MCHSPLVNLFHGHAETLPEKLEETITLDGIRRLHTVNDVLVEDSDGDGESETTSKRDLINLKDNLYSGPIGNAHTDVHWPNGEKSRCTDSG